MSFCYNCGVRRSSDARCCPQCGTRFDDGSPSETEPAVWGSLLMDMEEKSGVRLTNTVADNRATLAEFNQKNSTGPHTTGPIERSDPLENAQVNTSTTQPTGCMGRQATPDPDMCMGRMVDDVFSDFGAGPSESELELDIPDDDEFRKKHRNSKAMARARYDQHVRNLANYGYARLGFLNGSRYATRVLLRRTLLKISLRRAKLQQKKAREVSIGKLYDLGQIIYSHRDSFNLHPYQRVFEAVDHLRHNIDGAITSVSTQAASSADRKLLADGSKNRKDSLVDRNKPMILLGKMGLKDELKCIPNNQIIETMDASKKLKNANRTVDMYTCALNVYNHKIFARGLVYLGSIAIILLIACISVGVELTLNKGRMLENFQLKTGKQLSSLITSVKQLPFLQTDSLPSSQPQNLLDKRRGETNRSASSNTDSDHPEPSGIEKINRSLNRLKTQNKKRNVLLEKAKQGDF